MILATVISGDRALAVGAAGILVGFVLGVIIAAAWWRLRRRR